MRLRQRVSVEVADQAPPLRYQSRIEAMDTDTLVLSAPLSGGTAVRLPKGARLQVTLFDQEGAKTFMSDLVEQLEGEMPSLRVSRPERLQAVQRRRFFREPAALEMLCRLTTGEAGGVAGLTRNLSGGGVLMATERLRDLAALLEVLGAAEPLWLEISLPDRPLQALGNIRWWRLDDSRHQADLAFEFHRLAETERERMIRFLFVHQRQALRKVV